MSKEWARLRAQNIRDKVPIAAFLASLGYEVRVDLDLREQQFSCDLHGDGHDNNPSARIYPDTNLWFCIGVDEPVLTAQGWKSLREVGVSVTLSGDGCWDTPLGYLPRGQKEVFRVTTNAGYSVLATADHEISTLNRGWVPVRDLALGDVVDVPRPRDPVFPPRGRLPFSVRGLNNTRYRGEPRLSLPTHWSLSLGETLGYLFGDGWITPRKISGVVGLTSSTEDVEDARKIFAWLQKWSSGRGSESHRTDTTIVNGRRYVEDQYRFTIGNNGFCDFFCKLGLDKFSRPPNQRSLPWSIWQAPHNGVKGFLRGAFATDGSVFRQKDRKGVRVNLYSVSERFLLDVQLLLLQFGIHSRVHAPSRTLRPDGRKKHPAGFLQLATGKDILLFRQRVGIANARKQLILDSFEYNSIGTRPFKPTIKSIVPEGVQPVADLSMPREHSFVVGGIRVHNCFGCNEVRDAIKTVRDRDGVSFHEACRQIERSFGLRAPSTDGFEMGERPKTTPEDAIRSVVPRSRSFEQARSRLESLLFSLTRERTLPMLKTLGLWEAFDSFCWRVKEETWTERQGFNALETLRQRTMDLLKGADDGGQKQR